MQCLREKCVRCFRWTVKDVWIIRDSTQCEVLAVTTVLSSQALLDRCSYAMPLLALAPRFSHNRKAWFNGLRFRKLGIFQNSVRLQRQVGCFFSQIQLSTPWNMPNMTVHERLWISYWNKGLGRQQRQGRCPQAPNNMKRLRIATTGHGAASWQIFCAELAILRSVCKACFQNHLPANWSLVEDVPSKALVAKNLTQRGGEMLILNSSAGPAAADEKLPVTRTATHQLPQLSPATSQQFNSMCGMIQKPNVGTAFAVVLLRCTVLYWGWTLRGQEIISVRTWTTDSAVRLEDCSSSTFLVAVQEAALNGTLSSNNCTGAAGTLVSQGPVELRILTQPFSFAPFLLHFQVQRWSWVSVAGLWSLGCRFHASVACSAKEMPSLTRLVRHKSGMALAWLLMFITNEKQCSVHSPCAIISRLQSQIVQIRGAFSYCGKDSDLQFKVIQPISTQFLKSSNTGATHCPHFQPTYNWWRHWHPIRKEHVMSRAPMFEGSNWNVTGTETWIAGTATW